MKTLCLISSLFAGVVAWCALVAHESALGVVLNLEKTGVILALIGFALLIPARWGRGSSAAGTFMALPAVTALGWGIYLTYFTYNAQDVEFTSGDVLLAGSVYLPKQRDNVPGAVLVHGSGKQTRHELAFYARFLARRGVAAIIYDKRGAGDSGGDTWSVDYSGYAADTAAAFEHLALRPQVDSSSVGYFGFSEAEWTIPIACTLTEQPAAYVVIVGGAASTPAGQVREEITLRLRRKGFPEADVEAAAEFSRSMDAYLIGQIDARRFREIHEQALGQDWFAAAEDFPADVYAREDYAWWRSVMMFDATPFWQELRLPVLWLKGGRDDRSDATKAKARFKQMLPEQVGQQASLIILEEGDHMLLRWPLGKGTPPPVFVDGYPALVAEWILDVNSGR